MALSKRDQKTLTIIGVLVLGFVVYSFGIQPTIETYSDLQDNVDKARARYIQNKQTLAEAKSIDQEYARVEAQFPKDDPDREPSEVFNEEVVDIVDEQVGTVPAYSPPTTLEIKGAEGYEFLILPITVKTTLAKAANLLDAFEKKGYLIQSAKISRENDLNKDDLTLELNLGRIVKIAEEPAPAIGGAPGTLKLNKGR